PALLRPIYRWHDRRVGHLRHYSPDGLAARCRASGLEPLRTIYSAHWVKVWQLGMHLAARRLGLNDTSLWWRLEEADSRAADRPNGMHLSVLLERVPATTRHWGCHVRFPEIGQGGSSSSTGPGWTH